MKNILRSRLLKLRGAMTEAEVRRKSRAILENLWHLSVYREARWIMCYVDYRREVQTNLLIAGAMADHKQVTVPVTGVKEKSLTPSLLQEFPGDLVPGHYGIMEPKPGCLRPVDPGELDLIIVPGVAFDRGGNRLGYGGGYYDRFLPRINGGCRTVGLIYQEALLKDLSSMMEPYDRKVDYVVTEQGIVNCSGC